jgi:hypothetical protein
VRLKSIKEELGANPNIEADWLPGQCGVEGNRDQFELFPWVWTSRAKLEEVARRHFRTGKIFPHDYYEFLRSRSSTDLAPKFIIFNADNNFKANVFAREFYLAQKDGYQVKVRIFKSANIEEVLKFIDYVQVVMTVLDPGAKVVEFSKKMKEELMSRVDVDELVFSGAKTQPHQISKFTGGFSGKSMSQNPWCGWHIENLDRSGPDAPYMTGWERYDENCLPFRNNNNSDNGNIPDHKKVFGVNAIYIISRNMYKTDPKFWSKLGPYLYEAEIFSRLQRDSGVRCRVFFVVERVRNEDNEPLTWMMYEVDPDTGKFDWNIPAASYRADEDGRPIWSELGIFADRAKLKEWIRRDQPHL